MGFYDDLKKGKVSAQGNSSSSSVATKEQPKTSTGFYESLKSNGSTSSATNAPSVDKQKQYVDQMKNARLSEVATLKTKQAEEKKTINEMNRLGIGYSGQVKNTAAVRRGVDTRKKELDASIAAEKKAKDDIRKADRAKLPPVLKQVVQGLDLLGEKTKPAADIAMDFYTPGGGLTALNALTKGAGFGIAKAAPKLVNSALGRGVAYGAQEAVVGAPLGVANTLARNPEASNRELLEGAVYGGAGGAILGGGGKLLGEGVKAGVRGGLNRVAAPVIDGVVSGRNAINEVARENIPQSVRRVVSKESVPEIFPERVRRSFNEPPTPVRGSAEPTSVQQTAATIERPVGASSPLRTNINERGNIATQLDANLSDDLKQGIRERDNSYTPITNIESNARANENVKNLNAAESTFLGNREFSAEHVATGNRLLQELDRLSQAEKDPIVRKTLVERALNVSEKLAADLTTAGQTAQAASILKRLSPEGQLLHLQRTAKAAGKEVNPADVEIYRNFARDVQAGSKTGKETSDFLDTLAKLKAGEEVTPDEMLKATAIIEDAKKFIKSGKQSPDRLPKEMTDIRTRDKVVSFLNNAEQAALERIKARKGNLNSLPLGEWADHAIVASSQIAKGTIRAATYVEDMVRLFGEEIKPHAKAVYAEARKLLNGSSKNISEGKVGEAEEAFERLRNSQTPAGKVAEKFIRESEIRPGDVDKLRDLAKQLNDLKGESAQKADMRMQEILNKYQKASAWDRIQAIRYISMLFNTSTQAVNALSGPIMATTNYAADLAGGIIDMALSGASRGARQRTTQIYAANPLKFIARYIKNAGVGAKAGWKGVSPSGITGTGDIRGLTYKSPYNPLSVLERSLGAVSKGADYATYRTIATGELERQAKLAANRAGVKGADRKDFIEKFLLNPSDEALDIADKVGKNATFQRTDRVGGKIAEAVNNVKFKPAKVAANIIVPFLKTPGNIAEHAVDLTPVGAIRGIFALAKKEATAAERRDAIQRLGLSLVGGGLSATGFYLNQIGVITGNNESGDTGVDKLRESVGQGKYRLNVDGLGRYARAMLGGKGVESAEQAAKYRDGDSQIDYNKFQPLALPVAAGVAASEHKGEGLQKQLDSVIVDAGSSLFSMSALRGIQDAFQAPPGTTGAEKVLSPVTKIFESFLKSFSPGALAQETNRRDDTVRQVSYNKGVLTNVKEYFMSRTPGLSTKLPAKVDYFGNEVKKPSGIEGAYLNPYRSQVAPNTPAARKLADIYEASGDKAVAPSALPKSFRGKDSKTGEIVSKELDKESYAQIQKKLGDLQSTMINKIPDKLSPEQKVYLVEKIYDFTRQGASLAAKTKLGISVE
jgi:hypothetical protein